MLRLLNIEFQKLRYNRSAKIIVIIYFVLITFIALIASIEFDFAQIHFRLADQGIFNFPYIWHFNTYIAAILKLFLAIVIVSMVSNEYSYNTIKQNLIDGLSKKEFIMSKFLMVIVFATISTIFIFIVSMILGLIFSDYMEVGIIFSDMQFIFAYFLKLVAFFSMCLFFGVLLKRSAFALGFLIVWQVIEVILYSLLKWQIFRDTEIAEQISRFFPLNAMSNLIKEPISRLGIIESAASQLGESFTKTYEVGFLNIVIVIIWIALFIYWSYIILRKRDL